MPVKPVEVWHMDGEPAHVATVEVDVSMSTESALEFAYARTQNVEGSWSQGPQIDGEVNRDHHPSVTRHVPLREARGRTYGLRSTMPGDVFAVDGARWRCASVGFERMDEPLDPMELTDDCGVRLTGRRWQGCTLATMDAVRDAAKGNAGAFVWPDEGEFTSPGVWRFNDAHKGFEPLLIDATSAAALVAIYDALKEADNRAKLVRMTAKGRGHFGRLMEFTWRHVNLKFGPKS